MCLIVKDLKICNIPTLHYRRIKVDMIETYKIATGKYQLCVAPVLYRGSVDVTTGTIRDLISFM